MTIQGRIILAGLLFLCQTTHAHATELSPTKNSPGPPASDHFYQAVRGEEKKISELLRQEGILVGAAMGWEPIPRSTWNTYCTLIHNAKPVVGKVSGFADIGKQLEKKFLKKYRNFPYDRYDKNHLPGTKAVYLKRIQKFHEKYAYLGDATKKLLSGGCRQISDLQTQKQYLMASSQYFQIVYEALQDIKTWRGEDIERQVVYLRHKKFEDQVKAARKKSFFGF